MGRFQTGPYHTISSDRPTTLTAQYGTQCRIMGLCVRANNKVTVILPTALVEKATRASGVGLTPTIRQGLEAVIVSDAYRQLRKLRGKVRLSIDVKELRRD